MTYNIYADTGAVDASGTTLYTLMYQAEDRTQALAQYDRLITIYRDVRVFDGPMTRDASGEVVTENEVKPSDLSESMYHLEGSKSVADINKLTADDGTAVGDAYSVTSDGWITHGPKGAKLHVDDGDTVACTSLDGKTPYWAKINITDLSKYPTYDNVKAEFLAKTDAATTYLAKTDAKDTYLVPLDAVPEGKTAVELKYAQKGDVYYELAGGGGSTTVFRAWSDS